MRRHISWTSTALILALTAACGEQTSNYEMTNVTDNALLAEWTGPYGGVPAFDKMDLADVKPALEKGMELELAEIDAIANNPEPPTFENTIVALEGVGEVLDRVSTYRGIWSSNMSSPEYREIQMEVAPKLAEHRTKITQNQALFDRIRAVYESDEAETLRSDQQRVRHLPDRRSAQRASRRLCPSGGHGSSGARARGPVRRHQHALVDGTVPHVFRRA
jgi:peptidyl-dipeptidase Dcp